MATLITVGMYVAIWLVCWPLSYLGMAFVHSKAPLRNRDIEQFRYIATCALVAGPVGIIIGVVGGIFWIIAQTLWFLRDTLYGIAEWIYAHIQKWRKAR
jgi:uncharacterized membrane protein